MSSWLNYTRPVPVKKPAIVNFGYRQLLPVGTIAAKANDTTVVSGFYTMQGKHSIDVYKNYLRLFLEGCACKMVFYTEEAMVPFIRQCRRAFEDTTDIITIDKTKWTANKIPQASWESLVKDTTYNPQNLQTAEYYKFLYEKREFVKRTMANNPFKSTDFIWVNPTICKDSRLIPLVKRFPYSNRIVTDKLMLINQVPFEFSDEKVKTVAGVTLIPIKTPRINSAIIAGTKEKWIQYSDLYESTIKKFQAAGLFWGLDSIILTSISLENKGMISLIEPKPIIDPSWKSMYGLLYFGSNPVLYSLLTDKATYEKNMSIDELLALVKI